MNPKYPIYIVSKGRWESRLTSKALDVLGVPYAIIVEPEEFDAYAGQVGRDKVLALPPEYKERYDTCDGLGDQVRTGPGAARNFAWDYSQHVMGATRNWVLDDNIASFNRLNENLMVKVTSGAIFAAAEDFVDRYLNVAIAGFNYDFFAKAKEPLPPYVLNTRIYSCMLINNGLPMRWRGRYNEDTDLSLRALKMGLCTVQFNAFLQEKATTQTMKGGNTDEFYAKEGTLPKSEMLARLHPDVAKVVWRFNRWHHHVDYRAFKKTPLEFNPCVHVPKGVNNYGMTLSKRA
jgi:hypothetical protein